jgi:FtsH-binding integral membrane protein
MSGIGSFAIMALWGVVALSLLNFILPASSMMEWIIMGAVFALSAVLIAVETQQLKKRLLRLRRRRPQRWRS